MSFHEETPCFHKIYIRKARKAQGNITEVLQLLSVSRAAMKASMVCQEVKSATKKCLSAGQCCSRSVSYGFWTGGLGRREAVEHLSHNVRDVVALLAAPFG